MFGNSYKRSSWFEGLLYAENVGSSAATHMLMTNEFRDDIQFENGIVDYLRHSRRLDRLKPVQRRNK